MTTTATTPTPSTTDSLQTILVRDFRAACEEYAEARGLRAGKDSPAHRAAVAGSLSRVDALMDMYLETCTPR